MGALQGVLRRIHSIKDGLKSSHFGLPIEKRGDTWGIEVESSLAEIAVAKALRMYWDGGTNTFKRGDVGNLQVRWTSYPTGKLLVRQSDKDDEIFILVIGRTTDFNVTGWAYGKEAKQDKWKQTPHGGHPVWMMPQEALHPIRELPWRVM
jgi:hypothetical protein